MAKPGAGRDRSHGQSPPPHREGCAGGPYYQSPPNVLSPDSMSDPQLQSVSNVLPKELMESVPYALPATSNMESPIIGSPAAGLIPPPMGSYGLPPLKCLMVCVLWYASRIGCHSDMEPPGHRKSVVWGKRVLGR